MKLIYKKPFKNHPVGSEVNVGDKVITSDGVPVEVVYFAKPHKPSSSGKVSVREIGKADAPTNEFFVSVIDAEWIEREDRIVMCDISLTEQEAQELSTVLSTLVGQLQYKGLLDATGRLDTSWAFWQAISVKVANSAGFQAYSVPSQLSKDLLNQP